MRRRHERPDSATSGPRARPSSPTATPSASIVDGEPGEKTIRFTGINAMELWRYSENPAHRRGACMGLEATALVDRAIKAVARDRAAVRAGPRQPQRQAAATLGRGPRRRPLAGPRAASSSSRAWPSGCPTASSGRTTASTTRSPSRPRRRIATSTTPARAPARPHRTHSSPSTSTGTPTATTSRTSTANGSTSATSARPTSRSPAGGCATRGCASARRTSPASSSPSYAVVPAGGSVRLHAGCGENSPATPEPVLLVPEGLRVREREREGRRGRRRLPVRPARQPARVDDLSLRDRLQRSADGHRSARRAPHGARVDQRDQRGRRRRSTWPATC